VVLKRHLKDSPCSSEWIDVSYKPLGCIFLTVLHTLVYLRGTLPLGLKGRFYTKLVFVPKGNILHPCCLCLLNGNILCQTSGVKPNTIICKDLYLRGRFYTKYYLMLYIIALID